MRPTWLARFTSSAKVSSSVPPSVTGMPGAKEIVESQASASNTIRSVPPGPIARCWSIVIGKKSRCRIVVGAIVIAHDEQAAGVQIKAIDMTIRPNQVDGRGVRKLEVECATSVGRGQVRVG